MKKRLKLIIRSKVLQSKYDIETDTTELLLEGELLPIGLEWIQGCQAFKMTLEDLIKEIK